MFLVQLAALPVASWVVLCGPDRYARISVAAYDNDAAVGTSHDREYRGTAVFDPLDGTVRTMTQTKGTDRGGSITVSTTFTPGLQEPPLQWAIKSSIPQRL